MLHNKGRSTLIMLAFVALFQVLLMLMHHLIFTMAIHYQPIPRFDVQQLSNKNFDSSYLNHLPVIIQGASVCPSDRFNNFTSLLQYCSSNNNGGNINIPGNYLHTQSQTLSSKWAGLQEGRAEDIINLHDFILSMNNNNNNIKNSKDNLRYLFDLPMAEVCPTLPSLVRLAPQLVGAFVSHHLYKYKPKQRDDDSSTANKNSNIICTRLPFFNMYLAEGGFQTDLHIDGMHTAFVSSMCVGRKKWRIMTSQDFSIVYDVIAQGGLQVPINNNNNSNKTCWVMSSIKSPFDTWSNNNQLEELGDDVTIYEGILEPGQTLYIPPGSPHAAYTLDASVMVASNDRTLQSLDEALAFCDVVVENKNNNNYENSVATYKGSCRDFRRSYAAIRKHVVEDATTSTSDEKEHWHVETTTSLAKATGCESTFEMLQDSVTSNNDTTTTDAFNNRVFIRPENFATEIIKGPMVVMKSQNAAGWCLYLQSRENWHEWTQDFDPPIRRVGVLKCLREDRCLYGNNTLYLQLLSYFQDKGSPSFAYVTAATATVNSSNTLLRFRGYHGFLSLDDLRIWMSVQTGSRSITVRRRLTIWAHYSSTAFHWTASTVEYLVAVLGPSVFGILCGLLLLCLGVLTKHFWDAVTGWAWCRLMSNSRRGRQYILDGRLKGD